MELKKAAEHCYYTTFDEETDRPQLGYIKTDDKSAIMIDAGASRNHYREFCNLIIANNLPLPTLCVLTHSHWDHTFGLSDYNPFNTLALKETKDKMEKENRKLLSSWKYLRKASEIDAECFYATLSVEERFCIEHLAIEYHSPEDVKFSLPSIIISDNEISSPISKFGKVSIFKCPFSLHSHDSLFILQEKEKILYVGDGIYPHMDLDAKHDEMWLYERLPIVQDLRTFIENLDFDFCICGHSSMITKEGVLNFIDNNFFTI